VVVGWRYTEKWEAVEIDTDRFCVISAAQCGLGASSSPRQTHPREESGFRVKGVYEGVNFAHEESHGAEHDIRGSSPTTIMVPRLQEGQRERSMPVSSSRRSWADFWGISGKTGLSPRSFRH